MSKAFTLIELLVVISIIGILAAMVTVSFTSSQKQARDSQRKSDISQYRSSLETFANKSVNGLYPIYSLATTASTTLCTALGQTGCPEDPKTSNGSYQYQSDSSGSQYVLWAKLENTSNYWVVCSIGKSGIKTQSGFSVSGGTCPL